MSKEIFLGVLGASFIGSWHCAGMCGPFGFFLNQTKNKKLAQFFYHLGRLITYLGLAICFHSLGNLVRWAKAPWVFGTLIGAWVLLLFFNFGWKAIKAPKWLIKLNQSHLRSQSAASGFILGSTTTLLPCVWLYGFLILSSTQKSTTDSLLLMTFFWMGTIPSLVFSHNLLFKINFKIRKKSRILALVFLIAIGAWMLWSHVPSGCPLHPHKSQIVSI